MTLPTQALQTALLAWYREHARDLPWRRETDPYRIWLSEAMLQQTRVETAIPYYARFLARFPTLAALAEADSAEVLKFWEGLGYYRRIKHLHEAVREVQASYGGEVPADPVRFRALPGVGEYTAGAVLSIAYRQPLPAVDGNVLRVLARLLAEEGNIDATAARKRLAAVAAALVAPDDPGDWNQAIMELGATVCLPRRPRCHECPWSPWCQAHARGLAAQLPRRSRRAAVREEVWAVALAVAPSGRVCVQQRGPEGLLAGLWQFPSWPAVGESALAQVTAELRRQGLEAGQTQGLPEVRHLFSHLRWRLRGVRVQVAAERPLSQGHWFFQDELDAKITLATAHRRLAQRAGILPES